MPPLNGVRMPMPRLSALLFVAVLTTFGYGQERILTMPGYANFRAMSEKREGAIVYGRLPCSWAEDGKSFTAIRNGTRQKYDIETATWGKPPKLAPAKGTDRAQPARGRQFDAVMSPDGITRATSHDRNVFISRGNGEEFPVTTDGNASTRIKYGVASWVYGEELDQIEAMWFSPDGKKLAFYRFDESKVPDYYLAKSQTTVQDQLDTEAYPKAGAPNPTADVLVYDLESKSTITLDTRFGDPQDGHYVYNVRWSPDGKEILFFRENRKQNRMQMCAANPSSGVCRKILEETNSKGWVPYRPGSDWTQSGEVPLYITENGNPTSRFIWVSERNGYRNAYLYDLSGRLIHPITKNPFDLQRLEAVDAKGNLWYTAHDGKYPSLVQLHKVRLDGSGDTRVTDPSVSHSVQVSPTGDHFIDVSESLDQLPQTRLCDSVGKVLSVLSESDNSKARAIGLRSVERFTYTAADGTTQLYGYISKPSKFDPTKKYPLLVSVYGGPESSGVGETYTESDPFSEFGFIVAWFDGRGTFGRGRAFLDTVYRKLGIVEIDDQAAGVRALSKKSFIDASKVGIYGASYGGYASIMALFRYPDLFRAASASSPVTDWQNYDSTYTERYMGTPQDNEDGYRAASAMTYVKDKKGALLLYFGTADNNVHPSNTIQLINALDRESKSYELALGPDQEHSGVSDMRMMEFFIDHLVLGH